MNTATSTHEMIVPRHNSIRAFTIMELLVVISIIAVVAGLVVGLAGMAGKTSKIKRTESENERLVTLINSYHAKLGVYPRDNKNNPGMNSLLYELAGAIRDTNSTPNDPTYITPLAPPIQASVLNANFGVNGIQNAVDIGGETSQVHRLLKDVRPDQVFAVVPNTLSLVIPVDGPNGRPNSWRYLVGDNATNNPTTFDLWVDIVVGRKTNTIGNWKD